MQPWKKIAIFSLLSMQFGIYAGVRMVEKTYDHAEKEKMETYQNCQKTQLIIKDKTIHNSDTIYFDKHVQARIVPDTILFKTSLRPRD